MNFFGQDITFKPNVPLVMADNIAAMLLDPKSGNRNFSLWVEPPAPPVAPVVETHHPEPHTTIETDVTSHSEVMMEEFPNG